MSLVCKNELLFFIIFCFTFSAIFLTQATLEEFCKTDLLLSLLGMLNFYTNRYFMK